MTDADLVILEAAMREKDDMLAETYRELAVARRQIDMYRIALKELQARTPTTVPEGSFR